MKERIILYAEEGRILTDGAIYVKQIFLAEGEDKSAYYEVPEAEAVCAMENTTKEEELDRG